MISLIIPPKDQIARVAKMLADEFGTASNIKSRVNRLSVLGAITSVQQRLKLYNKGRRFSSTPFSIHYWFHLTKRPNSHGLDSINISDPTHAQNTLHNIFCLHFIICNFSVQLKCVFILLIYTFYKINASQNGLWYPLFAVVMSNSQFPMF